MLRFSLLILGPFLPSALHAAPIERIWLTHAVNDSSRITVNWETTQPGPSLVEFGKDESLGKEARSQEPVTLHHIEIVLAPDVPRHYYRVRSGADESAIHSFKGYRGGTIRVGVFADRGYARDRDLSILVKEDLHLLLSGGDNVASLHEKGIEGTKAFSNLIDSQGDLFRSTPFMPVLGNHDREITPRGPEPPAHPVYDIEATAYRRFFPLPDEGWMWRFDLPDYGARFLARDDHHDQKYARRDPRHTGHQKEIAPLPHGPRQGRSHRQSQHHSITPPAPSSSATNAPTVFHPSPPSSRRA